MASLFPGGVPRAVILAAGDGGRLGPHTLAVPKPLVDLGGRPIIDYTLKSLASAGLTEALVVTGYRSAQVEERLRDRRAGIALDFAFNSKFDGGAARSLAAARDYCGADHFLLVMSDHVLSAGLIRRMLTSPRDRTAVGADFLVGRPRSGPYVDEATRLRVDASGRVTALGKDLEPWDALDTGAFFCTPAVWDALGALPAESELGDVFGLMASRGNLDAIDVTGCFWYDIDTDADLRAAGEIIAGTARGL